jgi:hypothetical protein
MQYSFSVTRLFKYRFQTTPWVLTEFDTRSLKKRSVVKTMFVGLLYPLNKAFILLPKYKSVSTYNFS